VVETGGIGQADGVITDYVDGSIYVMTSEYGAATQLEKIEMLDYADFIVLNKFERRGSRDALRDIRKQVWRNRGAPGNVSPEAMPVFPTIAAQFNDLGVNALYQKLLERLSELSRVKLESRWFTQVCGPDGPTQQTVVPGRRTRYLSEVAETVRGHHRLAEQQRAIAQRVGACYHALIELGDKAIEPFAKLNEWEGKDPVVRALRERYNDLLNELDPACLAELKAWPELTKSYTDDENVYE